MDTKRHWVFKQRIGNFGITCRQPFLGADEWIEEEIKKASGSNEPATEKKIEAS